MSTRVKRSLCILLSLAMIALNGVIVFADDDNTQSDTINIDESSSTISEAEKSVEIDKTSNSISAIFSADEITQVQSLLSTWLNSDMNISSSDIELGNKIPIYEYKDGALSKFTSAKYYPVIHNGLAIGVFGIHGNTAKQTTYSVGEEWAEDINLMDGTPFCIVVTENKMFFKTADNADLVEEYLFAQDQKATRSNNSISESDISTASLENLDFYNQQETYSIQIPRESRAAYTVELPVGVFKQTHGYCWAVTTKLIGEYINSSKSYSPEQICDNAGIGYDAGGFATDCKTQLSKLYAVTSTIKTAKLSNSEYEKPLGARKPCYVEWIDTTNKYGHATTLCGAKDDSMAGSYQIKISDSNTGTYRWLSTTSSAGYVYSTDFIYTYGTLKYKWEDTVVPS